MYCPSKKFIFNHIGKCAGSSIKDAIHVHIPYNNLKCIAGHTSLGEMKKMISSAGEDASTYFVFTSVRNPWDRAVSLYYHKKTIQRRLNDRGLIDPKKASRSLDSKISFKEYIFKYKHNYSISKDYEKSNFIIRFENLQWDFDELCEIIKIPKTKLPKIDYSTGRPADLKYREYYDEESKNLVGEVCEEYIENFNYEF